MNSAVALQLWQALATPQVLLMIAAGQLTQLVALFIASKLVSGPSAYFSNALRCYAYELVVTVVGMGIGVGGVLGLSALGGAGGWLMLPFVLVWAVVFIYVALLGPARIYEISAGMAFLLLVVAGLGNALLGVPLRMLIRPTLDPALVARFAAGAMPQGTPAPTASKGPTPTSAPTPTPTPTPSPTPSVLDSVKGAVGQAAPDRPVPKEVVLAVDTRVPVILDGRVAGDTLVDRGTKFEVVGVEGAMVKVKYLDTVVKIPKSRLSY